MKNSTYIYQLIELESQSKLNLHQKRELEEWIQLSANNLSDYKAYRKILTYSDRLVAMNRIDADNDLIKVKSRFSKKGQVRKLYHTLQRIAAILVIPLLIYTAWSVSVNLNFGPEKLSMNTTETTFGVRTQIQLSDGSKVWLNSGSKLVYPERFTGKSREVKLTGEAYFEVESDQKHPFYVDMGGYKIKATGTKFNISNYADANEMNTYLEHGVVSLIGYENGNEIKFSQLNEGELVVVDKDKNQFKTIVAGSRKYLGWIDGQLIFEKDPMMDVAARIGRWFNVEVIVKDQLLYDYVFTATFEKESLSEALNLLSYSSPIKYEIIPSHQLNDATYSKRQVIISKK